MDTDADTDRESISDCDSFASFEKDMESMSLHISEMYGLTEELEEHLLSLHRPIEQLELSQLGDAPFLETSPFRNATFTIQQGVHFPGIEPGKRYMFQTICSMLRNSLFHTNAVQADGSIKLSNEFQSIFGSEREYVSYNELLMKLRNILV